MAMDVSGSRPADSGIVAAGGAQVTEDASAAALVTQVESDYGDAMFGFARRLGIEDGAAADVVQEGLLRLYDAIRGGTRVDDPRAWVFTVVYRLAMDEHRRRERWSRLGGWATPDPDGSAHDPVTVSERKLVWAEVDRLPERQRAVLYLRYRADLPFDAVGRVLGITSSAARSHATQAVTMLRSRLAGEGGN
jgi:RNA polymerase sigma factor (sigma-70 family)